MLRNHNQGLPKAVDFHENLADKWTAGYARPTFNKRLLKFRSILNEKVEAGQSWLDLGCGSGVLTEVLLDRHAIVTAVDASPSMLNVVKQLEAKCQADALRCILGDACNLSSVGSESFDGVICSSVMEYIEEPNLLVAEVSRVLKPGGILILSVPPWNSVVRSMQKVVRRVASVINVNKFQYLSFSKTEVGRNEIDELFGLFGFSVNQVTKFDPILPDFVLPLLPPSLLIIEGRKQLVQSDHVSV